MIKRLVQFCAIFAFCTIPAFGQGTQHDRIDARGYVKTDRFINRLFILITGSTPDVSLGNAFKTNNGSPVTITNFLNGLNTQELDLLCGDVNTTIQNNANISLTGGIDFICVVNVGISFRYDASQTKWVQFGGTGSGGGSTSPGSPAQSFQCNDGAGHFVACQNTPGGAQLNGTVGGTPTFGPLGNEALKPAAANAVQYVTATGNDTNDGLSWGTAKATIYGTMIALPGGSSTGPVAGSGTIYAGPNSACHPTAGVGIWFAGPGDPNYASPPAGWIKYVSGSIELIGVGATTPGILFGDVPRVPLICGSTADRNHPSLWISGMQGTFIPRNVVFSGSQRPIVLGECSNNSRSTQSCQVFGYTLEGIKAVTSRINSASGPTVDLPQTTAGSIRGSTFVGTAGSVTQLADNEANILLGTATSLGGSLMVSSTQLFYGGIKVLGNSQATLHTQNVDQYGDFTNPMPPTVWFTNWGNLSAGTLINTTRQDPAATQFIIRVDATNPFIAGPTVIGGFETTSIQGPATTFLGSSYYSAQAVNQSILGGKTGILNGYLFGETNIGRRLNGLIPVRYANRAITNPASWTSAGNTVTAGQADLYGGTGATKAHTSNVGNQNLLLSTAVAYTPQIGDWIVGGYWVRQAIPFVNVPVATPVLTTGTATIGTTKTQSGPDQGDGEWQWQYIAKKVSANSAATTIQLIAQFNSANDVFVYGPLLYIMPAAQTSDDEALWFAQSMNSHDAACGVGTICNTTGHPLQLAPDTFSSLGSQPDGTFTYCVNCQVTTPCASGGSGAAAQKINGTWVCNGLGVPGGANGTFLGISGGALSYIASSGTGSVCLTIGCALTTPTVTTSLTMNAAAELRFTTTGGYAGIKAPGSVGTNLMWQLPAADAVGCWASNGSFILSIIACGGGGSGTPGGSPGNIQYNNTAFTGSPALNWDFTNSIFQIGNTGGALGRMEVFGNTSGKHRIQAQAVAGTPTLLLPNTSGTFAVNASSPLALDLVTGALTAPTVITSAAPAANNQLVVGQSGQAVATVGSLGTINTLYHGNAAGVGSFLPVVDGDFSGQLGFPHGGTTGTTRQTGINALLDSTNLITGDLFFFDGTNVTRLARGSNGSCLTYTGVSPFIAPGSCAAGAITGAGVTNQLAIWSTSSTLTSSSNLSYVPAIGLSLTQGLNGSDTFLMLRATDSSPTGTYFRGRNAINTLDTFRIDTLGNFFGTSFTGVSTAAGFIGIGQGTAQPVVANTAGFTGPTSITGYNISVPAAAGTGVWRLTNAANVMSSTIVAASGVGSCTPANNVVVALNDNAAPQCSTVAGPMFGTQSANLVFRGPPSGIPAFPTFGALVSADLPPINLNTNGSNGGVTAILGFINGGCNATSASACFNNIWPGIAVGDTVYGGTVGAGTRLAGNITSTKMYYSQTGTGSVSAAPAWAQIAFPDISGVCTIAQGCSGQATANAALNAFLPAQGGNSGKVLGTDGANTTWVVGGGGGSGTPAPNYGTSFSSQTSVTITGVTHNLGTKNLLLACYDTSSPARAIQPASWTIDGSTFDVVVNFAASQSGYCAVNGSGPNRYAATFGSTSSLVVTGATHKLATADITVTIWDSASGTRRIIQPASVSIDSTTFDVTVIFASSQAGRIVIE